MASQSPALRNVSFWLYIASNILWVAWGLHDGAQALIALQFLLAALNIRGILKTEQSKG